MLKLVDYVIKIFIFYEFLYYQLDNFRWLPIQNFYFSPIKKNC